MPGIKRRKFEGAKAAAIQAGKPVQIRPAIYWRVSTEEQAAEGYSLAAQKEKLEAYCTSRDWPKPRAYVDEGASGRDMKRPGYQQLVQEIDQWDVLVVPKMDRIHRNARNFLAMVDMLRSRERDFVSISESLDTSNAMGRFVMAILAQIAELESDQIGERALAGMIQAVKERNVAMGTRAAYGYRWQHWDGSFGSHSRNPDSSVAGGKPSELVPDPETAPMVKRIFRYAAKGGSVQTISKELDWCACKPRQIKRKYVIADGTIKEWVSNGITGDCGGCTRIRYILQNPTYLGYFVFQEKIYPSVHEPLITRDLFEAYNKRRRNRVVLPDGKKKA